MGKKKGVDMEQLRKRCDVAMAALGLTAAQVSTIQSSARGIYEEVASDLDPENSRGTASRELILEVVMDAGRLRQEVLRRDPSLARAFNSYEILEDLVGPAFSYDYYEVGRG